MFHNTAALDALDAAKAADAQKRAADREAAAINIVQTCGPVETWTKAKLRTFLKCKGVKKVDTIKDKAEWQRLVKDLVHTQPNSPSMWPLLFLSQNTHLPD